MAFYLNKANRLCDIVSVIVCEKSLVLDGDDQ